MVSWLRRRLALWALREVGFMPFAEVHGCAIEFVVHGGKVWINANGQCVFRGHAVPEAIVNYEGVTLEHWVFTNEKAAKPVNRNVGLY